MNWYKKIASQIQNEKRLEHLYQKALQMKKTPEESSWIISILKEIGYDEYFKWLVKIVNTNNADINNIGDKLNLIKALKKYHKLKLKKKLSQEQTNLMRFKEVSDLYKIIDSEDFEKQDIEERLKGIDPINYKIVYHKGEVSVIHIDNWDAAEILFKDSNWCVRHRSTFKDFDTYPPNYYLFLLNGKNFALLNPEIQQFLDRNDHQLSLIGLYQIKDAAIYIQSIIKDYNIFPRYIKNYLENIKEIDKEIQRGNIRNVIDFFEEFSDFRILKNKDINYNSVILIIKRIWDIANTKYKEPSRLKGIEDNFAFIPESIKSKNLFKEMVRDFIRKAIHTPDTSIQLHLDLDSILNSEIFKKYNNLSDKEISSLINNRIDIVCLQGINIVEKLNKLNKLSKTEMGKYIDTAFLKQKMMENMSKYVFEYLHRDELLTNIFSEQEIKSSLSKNMSEDLKRGRLDLLNTFENIVSIEKLFSEKEIRSLLIENLKFIDVERTGDNFIKQMQSMESLDNKYNFISIIQNSKQFIDIKNSIKEGLSKSLNINRRVRDSSGKTQQERIILFFANSKINLKYNFISEQELSKMSYEYIKEAVPSDSVPNKEVFKLAIKYYGNELLSEGSKCIKRYLSSGDLSILDVNECDGKFILPKSEVSIYVNRYILKHIHDGNYNILDSDIYKKYADFSEDEIRSALKESFINKLSFGNYNFLYSEIYKKYPLFTDSELSSYLDPIFKRQLFMGNHDILNSDLFKKYGRIHDDEILKIIKEGIEKKLKFDHFDILLSKSYQAYPVLSRDEIKKYIENSYIRNARGNESFFNKYPFLIEMFPEYKKTLNIDGVLTSSKLDNWYRKIADYRLRK